MNKKLIIFIHGVRLSDPTGSFDLFKKVLGGEKYDFLEFNWHHLIDSESMKVLIEYQQEKGFINDNVGKILIGVGRDATAWKSFSERVTKSLKERLNVYSEWDKIFITHSLGACVALDFMERYGQDDVVALFTMALNFRLVMDRTSIKPLPWVNWTVKQDPLGWSNQGGIPFEIEQRKHKPFWFYKRNLALAHTSYLKSKKIPKQIKTMLNG